MVEAMGIFLSHPTRRRVPLYQMRGVELLNAVKILRTANPSCAIATIAMKEGDEYDPAYYSQRGQYTVLYDATSMKVKEVYID